MVATLLEALALQLDRIPARLRDETVRVAEWITATAAPQQRSTNPEIVHESNEVMPRS